MDLGHIDDDLLLGDDAEDAVPPSYLTSAPVMDMGFHPSLPILAVGLVSGEVEILEYKGNEVIKKPLVNDFSSWVLGRQKVYSEEHVVVNSNQNNMRMHPIGCVSALEFTDDGNYLVSASSDRTISVLDCISARLVIHISSDELETMTASKKKMNASNKKNPTSGTHTKTKKTYKITPNPHKFGISALNVCDDNYIATGDDDGLIAIWDMRERKPVHTYHEHGDYVSQLCYFTDVQEIVSSSGDTCLGVYDLKAGKIRDYSEKRKQELNCFAFINSSGANNSNFIPSIMCGTPDGTLPIWKYNSWRRPYDTIEYHPREVESIISFHGEDTSFNHNVVLTGSCDGLVRVIQMYPLRRNLCQLSARDYTYSHANSLGDGGAGYHYHNSNYIVKKRRGQEGISKMRVSYDSNVLAVSGADNIIDFVDVRFLNDAKQLDKLRGKAEQRHMQTLRRVEADNAKTDEQVRLFQENARAASSSSDSEGNDSSSESDVGSSDSSEECTAPGESMLAKFNAREATKKKTRRSSNEVVDSDDTGMFDNADDSSGDEPPTKKTQLTMRRAKQGPTKKNTGNDSEKTKPEDLLDELLLNRQEKRERVAAAKWLKEEKRKKINFIYEKRRRRVGGFFGDMINRD